MISRVSFKVSVGIGIFILAVDILTKYLTETMLEKGETIDIVNGLVALTKTHNYGVAFGLLSHSDNPWVTAGITLIGIVSLAMIIYLYFTLQEDDIYSKFGFILVTAGAIGNILNRLVYGYVIDMIIVYIWVPWPIFNLADISISFGISILFIRTWMNIKKDEKGELGRLLD